MSWLGRRRPLAFEMSGACVPRRISAADGNRTITSSVDGAGTNHGAGRERRPYNDNCSAELDYPDTARRLVAGIFSEPHSTIMVSHSATKV